MRQAIFLLKTDSRNKFTQPNVQYAKHDHLKNATGTQQISRLCLLDLSLPLTQLITISYCVLSRLSSWFRIHGTVLTFFQLFILTIMSFFLCQV